MAKSPDAFRTISEVADWLGIQAHVLRFWESKFTQVKPIKRAGGRRYYRPADMLLLGGIKKLLHDDGLTIKGVQKILREDGMSHVSDLSQPLDELTLSEVAEEAVTRPEPAPAPTAVTPEEKGVVLNFEAPETEPEVSAAEPEVPEPAAAPPAEEDVPTAVSEDKIAEISAQEEAPAAGKPPLQTRTPIDEVMRETPAKAADVLPEAVDREPAPIAADAAEEMQRQPSDHLPSRQTTPVPDPTAQEPAAGPPDRPEDAGAPDTPVAAAQEPAPADPVPPRETIPAPEVTAADDQAAATSAEAEESDEAKAPKAMPDVPEPAENAAGPAALPAFLHRPLSESPKAATPKQQEPERSAPVAETSAEQAPGPAPRPRIVEVPELRAEAEMEAVPGTLRATYRLKAVSPAQARDMAPLLTRLTALRDGMAARRRNASALNSSN